MASKLVNKKTLEEIGFEDCHTFICGAAPLPRACIEYFLSLNITLLDSYGMSESTGPTTTNTNDFCSIFSVGKVINGAELAIKDPHGEILPYGTKGEICIKSRSRFMGYYKNEQTTRQTIDCQGFVHSGDEGFINEQGYLFVTGRYKELIITAGGENIPPILIENTLKKEVSIISNAFLVGDQRKFVSVLISFKTLPDVNGTFTNRLTDEVVEFAKTLGVNAKIVEDLIGSFEIRKFIDLCIFRVNQKAISRAQEIKKFGVIVNDFSVAGGELTPTMKIKRKFVLEKYAALIDEIYNS